MKHPSLKNVVQVAAGGRHSMALMRGGELWGWGSNAKGELGVKDNNERYNPVLVMAGVKAVACGSQHTLALLEDGTLWTWGLNKCGLLGLGSATDGFNSPQMLSIPKSADIVSIGCCAEHSFAMTRGGKLYMWGLTARGRLGLGPSRKESMTPTELADFRWKRKSIPWSFARLLFMAHKSRRSLFSKLPKELLGVILYHFSWC
jgi:alpha-tubulin suppressor-like RCC1 family protein